MHIFAKPDIKPAEVAHHQHPFIHLHTILQSFANADDS